MCERAHCPTVSICNEKKRDALLVPAQEQRQTVTSGTLIAHGKATWNLALETWLLYKAASAAHAPPPSQIHGWRQDSPWPSTQVAELNGAEARLTRRPRLKQEV